MSRVSSLFSAARAPDALLVQRLQSQIRAGQSELLRIQDELVTGQSIQRPSDNPADALRSMLLKGLIAHRAQMATNLELGDSFLAATDGRLNDVNGLLGEARAAAIAGGQNTVGDEERSALAETVRFAVDGLLNAANAEFQGRRLFAGGAADQLPFVRDGEYIRFTGDELTIDTFADFDRLFATNISGAEVFGAVSKASPGTDLDVAIRPETRIASLHRGAGVDLDAVVVTDGVVASTIDLSSAETIGDVAELLAANPPPGRKLQVDVRDSGLVVRWNDGFAGTLQIRDLAGGNTARRLGIEGAGSPEIVGRDLDPEIERTSSLGDLLGARAYARLDSAGADNGLIVEAAVNGQEFNDYQVFLLDDNGLQAGAGLTGGAPVARVETAPQFARAGLTFAGADNDLVLQANSPGAGLNDVRVAVSSNQASGVTVAFYDPITKVFSIDLAADGTSTAQDVVNAVAAEPSGLFNASLDVSAETGNTGLGTVGPLGDPAFARTAGGSDGPALFIHAEPGDATAEQVAYAINEEGTFVARVDPSDDTVGSPGLGQVEIGVSAVTAGGAGEAFDGAGLRIENRGETFDVDLSTATTVEDVLNELNRHEYGLLADLDPTGAGIRVRSRISGADFSIGELGGATARQLGLQTMSQQTRLEDLNRGLGVDLADGPDLEIVRTDGVTFQVDLTGAETVGDVMDAINNDPANLASGVPAVARLKAFGSGLEIVHDDPGGATPLEVRSLPHSDALLDLGLGAAGSDVGFAASAPVAAEAAFAPAGGNNDFLITAPATGETANGIEVVYTSGVATGDQALVSYDPGARRLTIDVDPGATTTGTIVAAVNTEGTLSAALDLGAEPANDGSGLATGLAGTSSSLAGGQAAGVTGVDVSPQEVMGAFDSLLRLAAALEAGDQSEIERAVDKIDADEQRAALARGEVGAAQQHLGRLSDAVADEDVQLKKSLSDVLDVDFADAISRFTQQQTAVEAALRAAAQARRMSLLDFL